MKSAITIVACFLLALAVSAPPVFAIPVSGWVTTNGDATFTGGSEATSSPSVSNLPGDAIAANFPVVTLADGDALTLMGSVTFIGGTNIGGNQFRFGFFDSPGPVTGGVGSGYIGINADAPSGTTSAIKFADGTQTNPFSGTASTIIAPMSNPGGAAPTGTAIDFFLSMARDGNNLDLEATISNTAHGGTWSSSTGVVQDYATPGGFTFDSVNFLMGSSVGGNSANYANVSVTYAQIPEPTAGLLMGLGLMGLLGYRRYS